MLRESAGGRRAEAGSVQEAAWLDRRARSQRSGTTAWDTPPETETSPVSVAPRHEERITWRVSQTPKDVRWRTARIRVPTDPWFSPADCSVRFFKNGWTDEYFHVDISRPDGDDHVYEAPSVFRLTIPVYSAALAGNSGIRRRDAITIPETVSLLPDDMRFWGDDYRFASPLPRRATPHDAFTRYVMADFAVQNGPRNDPPYLVGTFSDWEPYPENRLTWNDETRAYEIHVPLREEQFFYTYVWTDPNTVRPQSKFEGPGEVVFTGVVYANDRRYPTERILAVKSQTLPDQN